MANKWPMRPINYGASVYSGFAFKSEDFSDAGIQVVKIKNVNNRAVDLTDTAFFPETKLTDKHSKFFLKDRDVLIAMTGQGSVGRVGRVRLDKNRNVLLNQRVGKFITIADKLDIDYLFYVISTPYYEQILFDAGSGSGQPNLSPQTICSIEIPFPPPEEQRAIAHILGTLDDKIELNCRMNETLEAMARALFKAWFVDFEPVRAKLEGRWRRGQSLPGLPAHLYDLFPDRLVDSELGDHPEGWEMQPLDAIANFLNGLALQKFPPENEDEYLPVIKIAQLRAGNTIGADKASTKIKPEYIIANGDVLFSWSGSLEVEIWNGGCGALNQHLFKVTSEKVPKWFYFFATRDHLQDFRAIAAGKATTMGHIQRKHLTDALIAVPPSDDLEKLDRIIAPLFGQMVSCGSQSRTLALLRDSLLPKLISGELHVPEVEHTVSEKMI